MKKPKPSKSDIEQEIKRVFASNPSPKEIKKAKKLAMSKNIKLGILRKKFCKKCYTIYSAKTAEIRIKKPHKIIKCKNCGYVSRFKL